MTDYLALLEAARARLHAAIDARCDAEKARRMLEWRRRLGQLHKRRK